MLQRQVTIFCSAILLAATAQAQQSGNSASTSRVRDNGLSYTYVDGGYQFWNYDYDGRGDLDADNLFVRGSYALDNHIFLRGGVSTYEGDGNFDGQRLSVGGGFHTPLQDRLDLVVSGDFVHDFNDIDDENGLIVRGGVRHDTTSELELGGGLFYENIYDDLDDMGVYGRGMVHVSDEVDVGADVRLAGDISTFGLFGRYNF